MKRYGLTTLELTGDEMDVELKILSRQGKRERRAFAREFLRQFRPWLNQFTDIKIDHAGHGLVLRKRSLERGMKLFSGKDDNAAIGYRIRMRRLKLGLSQTELARQVGILRSHLSDLERGVHRPSRETQAKIDSILGIGQTGANVGCLPDTERKMV